ncbi:MAG: LysR substrate-binding domain-containing protein [Pseudomonadota bacterium]
MPSQRLPALTALRAFEAVARHGSFKAAAEELFVTPGALSQQVRKLEDELDTPLFIRRNRLIEPTPAGIKLRAALTDAFLRIREAVDGIVSSPDDDRIVVACGPPFAAKWLVPRLGKLLELNPDADIRVAANFELLEYDQHDIDVGIRFGFPEDAETGSELLHRETVLPLASPAFVERHRLREPRDLLRAPIIADGSMEFAPGSPDWARWFSEAGLAASGAQRGVNFGGHAEQAIDAAVAGAGVVLGRRTLAQWDIEAGRLVAPFGPELDTGLAYRLCYQRGGLQDPRVQAFRDWIVRELGAEGSVQD